MIHCENVMSEIAPEQAAQGDLAAAWNGAKEERKWEFSVCPDCAKLHGTTGRVHHSRCNRRGRYPRYGALRSQGAMVSAGN